MGKIFISYANEDHALASDINERLRQSGHDVFFDESNLKPSDAYDQVIQGRLAKSDIMLFLCSKYSLSEGRYTLSELEMAKTVWKKPQGRVLPVLLGDTGFHDLPSYLKGLSAYRQKGDPVSDITQMANDLVARRQRKKRTLWGGGIAAGALLLVAGYQAGMMNTSTSLTESPTTGQVAAETAPAKPVMDRDIPTLNISDDMLTYPKDYEQAQYDVPDTWSFCPGIKFNILNTSSKPVMFRIGIAQSGSYEDLGAVEAGDFMETNAPEDQGGAFVITDTRTKNVFYHVMLNPQDCKNK